MIEDLEKRRLSCIIWMCSEPNPKCPSERQEEIGCIQEKRGPVTMEAGMGVMWPQVKERQQPPETKGGEK